MYKCFHVVFCILNDNNQEWKKKGFSIMRVCEKYVHASGWKSLKKIKLRWNIVNSFANKKNVTHLIIYELLLVAKKLAKQTKKKTCNFLNYLRNISHVYVNPMLNWNSFGKCNI